MASNRREKASLSSLEGKVACRVKRGRFLAGRGSEELDIVKSALKK